MNSVVVKELQSLFPTIPAPVESNRTANSLTLNWEPVYPAREYWLQMVSENEKEEEIFVTSVPLFEVVNLATPATYHFRVKVLTQCGLVTISPALTVDFSPPGKPTYTTLSQLQCAAQFTWTPPTGTVTGYQIQVQTSQNLFQTIDASLCTDPHPTTCILPMNVLLYDPFNMQKYEIVEMRVRAYNANGKGPWAYSTQSIDMVPLKLDLPPVMKVFAA